MTLQEEKMRQIRANIAEHERPEKARVDRLVKEASKETEVWAAERAHAKRKAEQAQEAALVERDRLREATARDDA
jgi:hypothetical protein